MESDEEERFAGAQPLLVDADSNIDKESTTDPATFTKGYTGISRIRTSSRISEVSRLAQDSAESAWFIYRSVLEWGSAWTPFASSPSQVVSSLPQATLGTTVPKARVAFRHACACIDDNVRLFDRALQHFNTAIRKDPKYTDALLGRAHLHLRLRRFKDAISDYVFVLDLCHRQKDTVTIPKCARKVEALLGRSRARVCLSELERALQDVSDALEVQPKCVAALLHRSRLYLLMNRTQEALSDAQGAAALDGGGGGGGGSVRSQAQLASVLAARGEFKEAMRHADQAVQDAPNDPLPYISRSAVLRSIGGEERLKVALADANAALKAGGSSEAHYARALVYMQLKHWEKAITDLTEVLNDEKRLPEPLALRKRVECLQKLGREEEAILDRMEALRISANRTEAIQAFGQEAREVLRLRKQLG